MVWQTNTPDGRMLLVRHTEEGWVASCHSNRVVAATAEEAIRGAIGTDESLAPWIAEHAAALEQDVV